MASNTFYASSMSNTTYNALKNGGEYSKERSASLSVDRLDLGYANFVTSGTIPQTATINSVTMSAQIKQNRTNTSLYQTSIEEQLYVGSTAKSSNNISDIVADSYTTKSYTNSSSITSSSLYTNGARIRIYMRYKGTLKTTQYIKNVKIVVNWDAIYATGLSLSSSSLTLYIGGTQTLTPTYTPSAISYPRSYLYIK